MISTGCFPVNKTVNKFENDVRGGCPASMNVSPNVHEPGCHFQSRRTLGPTQRQPNQNPKCAQLPSPVTSTSFAAKLSLTRLAIMFSSFCSLSLRTRKFLLTHESTNHLLDRQLLENLSPTSIPDPLDKEPCTVPHRTVPALVVPAVLG